MMNLEEAMKILRFSDVKKLPKMRELQKQYREQSMARHPDRNDGSKESTLDFQRLLDAYQFVGKIVEKENLKNNSDDDEE